MNRRLLTYATLIGCGLFINYSTKTITPHTITLFVSPLPFSDKEAAVNEGAKNPTSSIISNKISAKTIDGLYCTYVGKIAFSTKGQISFARKHLKPKFFLLVTDRLITPVFMLANMIHHWEINKNSNSKLFSVNLEQDPDTKLSYWTVKPVNLPQDGRLALNFITLMVDDIDDIYVPTGITVAGSSPQLVLPKIYAQQSIQLPRIDLSILNIRPFFSSVERALKRTPNVISSKIV